MDRGSREATDQLRLVGRELRDARAAANLSQLAVARAAGISHPVVSRIERATEANVSLRRLGELASVLGMRLSVRLYPVGNPLRDAPQLALLERLHARLHSDLGWRTEVILTMQGDLRAWDASISGFDWIAYVDAETRIRDVQALQRRTMLKRRDTGTDRVILLIADTRANRAVLRALGSPLLADAIDGRSILDALAAGRDTGGSGVILL
ncbi:MAG: helix-turn-helix transcriptional regulator [Chloroflexi bacterium]|nr:MAG: helix-turn-helix transcriptional regulator [Chloroflexota bacterium]